MAAARCAAPSSTAPTRKRTTAVTGSCQRQRVGGDHLLPVANGLLQGLLRRSGRCASRSQGTDIGHTLAHEVPQAFTEAVLNVLYPHYLTNDRDWGIAPIDDQALGGVIMWVVGDVAFLAAMLLVVVGWMRHEDRRTARLDARLAAERAARR